MEIAKLHFKSPLHLSKGKSGLDTSFEVLHSDTLKSALFVCALELDLIQAIEAKQFFQGFTISSAFPFINSELFFPKLEWMPSSFTQNTSLRKVIKKIKYFGKSAFEELLKGELVLAENLIKEKYFYTQFSVKHNQPFKSETVQRVVVNRTSEQDNDTFYTERLFFSEDCGLFFIIDFKDDKFRNIIQSALSILGENGVGSDTSVGNGHFEFNGFEKIAFEYAQNANMQVALSLYAPKAGEVNEKEFINNSAYSLIKRGGYIASPEDFDNSTLRKKSVIMFNEGSVFPNTKILEGDIKDLKPDIPTVNHSIWRDGRALFLPCNLKI